MAGRREQLRATLMQSIRDAALAELRRTGPADLSLREVARAAGISPSGLYRYVDGRDGLLELLIADGFERFGVDIGSAIDTAGADLALRLRAMARAYRQWALGNQEQFALILGTPVIGFQPDPDGPTAVAVRRFGLPMLRLLADAHAAGELAPVPGRHRGSVDLSEFDPALGKVPAALLDVAMRSWARIHGLVILEVFGHLAWAGRDVGAMVDAEAASMAAEFAAAPGGAGRAAPARRSSAR